MTRAARISPVLGPALLAVLWLSVSQTHAACSAPVVTTAPEIRALSDQFTDRARRTAAIACLQEQIARTAHGDPASTIMPRFAAARLLDDAGDLAGARQVLEPAVGLAERAGNQVQMAVVSAYLGRINVALGDYAAAEPRIRHALSVLTKERSAQDTELGWALEALAYMQRDQGDYDDAERTFAQAQAIADSRSDADHDDLSAALHNNLAGLWYYRSHYRKAIAEYEAARRIVLRRKGARSPRMAAVYHNLGRMYGDLGAQDEAQRWFDRALELKLRLYGPEHPLVAGTVSSLAQLAEERGDFDESRRLYEQSLAVYTRIQGPDHPNVATIETRWAGLELKAGNPQRARDLMEHAVATRERRGPDTSWVAESLLALGEASQALGREDDARHALERALLIANIAGESELLAASNLAYARLLSARQQFAAAVFFGKNAVNLLQDMRSDVAKLGLPVERSFIDAREPTYRALVDWLITLGRLPEAHQVLDMLKEEEYLDFVRMRATQPDVGATRAQLTPQERAFAARLGTSVSAFGQSRSQADRARFYATLRRGVDGPAGPVSPASGAALSTVSASRTKIGDGVALLRYVVLPDRLRILVASRTREWWRDAQLPSVELNRKVFQFREELQDRRADPRPAGRELHGHLIAPIEADLRSAGIRRLLIVEDGTLRYLPFGALFDGERYLIESYEIQVATPAAGAKTESAARPQDRVAAFGVTQASPGHAALTGVATELDRIVKVNSSDRYGVLPGFVALDTAFTARRLQDALTSGFPAVHIASHFVFRPGPVAESYLVLGNGARLTLAELRSAQYPLHDVGLLTLSACETAVGQPDATGREFESFGVLAQRQGAQSVLATLWPVTDLSTATFMARFYRELPVQGAEGATASALRRAQLAFLNTDSGRPGLSVYRHPFYWAPYVVMGAAR